MQTGHARMRVVGLRRPLVRIVGPGMSFDYTIRVFALLERWHKSLMVLERLFAHIGLHRWVSAHIAATEPGKVYGHKDFAAYHIAGQAVVLRIAE